MTLQEALALVAQVKREEPRIGASVDNENAKTDGRRYRVRLELRVKQRVLLVQQPNEWESVKQAWSPWLPGLYVEQERKVRYLVNGYPTTIYLAKDGYWKGTVWKNGKITHCYFGKDDPRDNYPIVEKEEQEKVG